MTRVRRAGGLPGDPLVRRSASPPAPTLFPRQILMQPAVSHSLHPTKPIAGATGNGGFERLTYPRRLRVGRPSGCGVCGRSKITAGQSAPPASQPSRNWPIRLALFGCRSRLSPSPLARKPGGSHQRWGPHPGRRCGAPRKPGGASSAQGRFDSRPLFAEPDILHAPPVE